MYKTLFLTLSLFCYNPCWAESGNSITAPPPLSPEELLAAETEFSLWFNQFNEHLLESKDHYEKAMGIAAMINGTLSANNTSTATDNNQLLQQQATRLNKIINEEKLSEPTLDLLATWCFKESVKGFCDHNKLLNTQLRLFSDNLNVYLKPLQIAQEKNDWVLINQIFERMAEAKRSEHSHFITPAFNQKIDAYIENNPVPTSYVKAFKNDQALLSDLPSNQKLELDDLIKNYFPTSVKMSYIFLNETPDFTSLYSLCKANKDAYSLCSKVTQVMINQSNSMFTKGVGYATLMAMHEINGNYDLLETVKAKQETYKVKVQCLTKASQTGSMAGNFLDPEYQRINLQAIDELERQKQLAEYVYKKYSEKMPDLIDPKNC